MRRRGAAHAKGRNEDEVIDLRERLAPYYGSAVRPLTREERLARGERSLRARPRR